MGTMLILKAALLLGVATESMSYAVTSSSTSERPVTTTTSKSKRDFTTPSSSVSWSTESSNYQGRKSHNVPYSTTSIPRDPLEAETTVRSVSGHEPSQSVTYSPYQYYDSNAYSQYSRPRGQQSAQATSAQPPLQGGFQASKDPRQLGSTNGIKKSSTLYTPQSSQRIQNKLSANGQNSQYFANPSSYRIHSEPSSKNTPQITLSSFTTSTNGQNFPKFRSQTQTTQSRPNRRSPGIGSFETLPRFRFNPTSSFSVQSTPLVTAAQRSRNTVYPSNTYHGAKSLDIAPTTSFSGELSGGSGFKTFNGLGDNYQYAGGAAPGAGYANKQVSIPETLQFQNSPQVAGFIQAFENEPVLLGSGLDYQTQQSSGLSFDFPKSTQNSLQSGGGSFGSQIGNYQARILPVHSSSSTAQLPQYKGASINAFGNGDYAKPDGGYQLLANQPQLHFTSANPLQSVGGHRPTIYHSNRPFEQIRTDVEVINKKRPIPKPDVSYEHDFDGGFKIGKDVGQFNADSVDDVSAPAKSPVRDISFELPTSNLFNSYDEAFGKYSKLASVEQDKVKVSPKPVYLSAEVDVDDEVDDKSGEFRSSYTDGVEPVSSYEDEDEEESRRSERLETRGERDRKKGRDDDGDDDDDDDESDAYKSYGVDFEKEFEESYRKELPKTDYVHVKEVPEIEEPTSESKKRTTSRNSPKTSRGSTKQKSRHVVQAEYEEPKEYESYTTHKYEKPKEYESYTTRKYEKPKAKDSEGHGTRSSYRTTTSSAEPEAKDAFGYKVTRDRGTKRYTKREDSEMAASDEDEPVQVYPRKSPSNTRDSAFGRPFNSSRSSSTVQRSASPTLSPIELIKTFTFPPFSSARAAQAKQPATKQVSRATDSYGAPSLGVQAFVSPDEQTYSLPLMHREGLRYFANGPAVRELAGI